MMMKYMSRTERLDILAAVELLRKAANASYDLGLADFPFADDDVRNEIVRVHGVPRYILFDKCHRAMIHLMDRVWGFTP